MNTEQSQQLRAWANLIDSGRSLPPSASDDMRKIAGSISFFVERYFDGVNRIRLERERQKQQWGDAHDDSHTDGSLAAAAACLAVEGTDGDFTWPYYDTSWIKSLRDKHASASRVRQLEIAGALIAAELDREKRLRGVW